MADDQDFMEQIRETLKFEGGYVNDPADPGGETKYGISKRAWPNVDIANLTLEDAIDIYKAAYWTAPGIYHLHSEPAMKLFDCAVNMGARTAIKLWQRGVNTLDWQPHLMIDGVLGARSLDADRGLPPTMVTQALRSEMRNHYIALATAHPTFHRFLGGWLRRADA